MPENKALALITNDDGIDSLYLHALAKALQTRFRIIVVAPTEEQSWIGRKLSRRDRVTAHKIADFPLDCDAWAIGGTPTDCVNIALGHLLPKRPDIVVSGINLGYNTTQALISCSGTVAGASEGAFWGLPAIAFSKAIRYDQFETIANARGRGDAEHDRSLENAARHAVTETLRCLEQGKPAQPTVINVNFPPRTTPEATAVDTIPAPTFIGTLFEPVRDSIGGYAFRYTEGRELPNTGSKPTDLEALNAGNISRSVLDFSRLGGG